MAGSIPWKREKKTGRLVALRSVSSFFKNAGTLFTGTVLGQVVNLLAYPAIARTYDAAAFGEFALFLSTASIIGTVSCLRFDVVVQAAHFFQRQAAHRLGVTLAFFISLIAGFGYFIIKPFASTITVIDAILLALAIFLTGYCLSAQALLIKHERYRVTALAAFSRTIFTAIPQILLFWLFRGSAGLTVGYCLGAAVQAAIQAQALSRLKSVTPSSRRMLALLMRYRMFPLFDVPSALVATASLYAGNFVVFALYGASKAGVYAMAFRLAALPLSLIGSNLSEVFFQKASRERSNGRPVWTLMRTTLSAAAVVAAGMTVGILFLSGPVIQLYLGPKWHLVGPVLIALTPMMALRLIAVSVGSTPLVLRRPQWSLISNILLFLILVLASVTAWLYKMSFLNFLWVNSLSSAVLYTCYVLFLVKVIIRHGYTKVPLISSGEG